MSLKEEVAMEVNIIQEECCACQEAKYEIMLQVRIIKSIKCGLES